MIILLIAGLICKVSQILGEVDVTLGTPATKNVYKDTGFHFPSTGVAMEQSGVYFEQSGMAYVPFIYHMPLLNTTAMIIDKKCGEVNITSVTKDMLDYLKYHIEVPSKEVTPNIVSFKGNKGRKRSKRFVGLAILGSRDSMESLLYRIFRKFDRSHHQSN